MIHPPIRRSATVDARPRTYPRWRGATVSVKPTARPRRSGACWRQWKVPDARSGATTTRDRRRTSSFLRYRATVSPSESGSPFEQSNRPVACKHPRQAPAASGPASANHQRTASPHSSATSKRTRAPCKAPAVRGWSVCRLHGARGGAPKGPANGAYRHGMQTNEAVSQRRAIRSLIAEARATIIKLGDG